jgi:hypothetical protein
MSRFNHVGQRFTRLRVVAFAGRGPWRHDQWHCICDDGNCVVVRGDHLRRGLIKSCGCLRRELSRQRQTKHGMRRTPEYLSWLAMKSRVLNPHNPSFRYYGGREPPIEIYPDWILSFTAWFADAGPRPHGCTQDRIDVNGHYVPNNIRWADAKTQRQNQRKPQRKKKLPPSAPPLDDPPF